MNEGAITGACCLYLQDATGVVQLPNHNHPLMELFYLRDRLYVSVLTAEDAERLPVLWFNSLDNQLKIGRLSIVVG